MEYENEKGKVWCPRCMNAMIESRCSRCRYVGQGGGDEVRLPDSVRNHTSEELKKLCVIWMRNPKKGGEDGTERKIRRIADEMYMDADTLFNDLYFAHVDGVRDGAWDHC